MRQLRLAVERAAVVGDVLGQPPGQVQALQHELDRRRRPRPGRARRPGRAGRAPWPAPAPCRPGAAARRPTTSSPVSMIVALGDQVDEAGQVEPGQPGPERLGGGACAAGGRAPRPRGPPRRSRTRPCRAACWSTDSVSPTRATALAPRRAAPARRSAAAATVSAAAIANRAETPDRGSTAGDSRTPRVNRATTSSRCSGTSATRSRLLPDQRRSRARGRAGSGCGSRRRTGP